MISESQILSTPQICSLTTQSSFLKKSKTISKAKVLKQIAVKKIQESINQLNAKSKQCKDIQYEATAILQVKLQNVGIVEQNCTLGQLYLDELVSQHRILQRKIEKDSIECRLSPRNIWCLYTDFTCVQNLPQNEILNFLKQLHHQETQLNERKQFEEDLAQPFQCIQLSYQNDDLIGISKKLSYDYLRLMGLNLEIIENYISTQNMLPECWQYNSILKKEENGNYIVQLKNYQGETFLAKVVFTKFQQITKNNSLIEQFIYIVIQCGRQYLNVTNIERNFLHYFQLRSLSLEQEASIHKSRSLKCCQTKPHPYTKIFFKQKI